MGRQTTRPTWAPRMTASPTIPTSSTCTATTTPPLPQRPQGSTLTIPGRAGAPTPCMRPRHRPPCRRRTSRGPSRSFAPTVRSHPAQMHVNPRTKWQLAPTSSPTPNLCRPPICEICARDPSRTAKQRNQKSHLFNFYTPTQYQLLTPQSTSRIHPLSERPHRPKSLIALFPHHANPFVTADPDASPPPSSVAAAATSSAPTLTTATSANSPPVANQPQQLEAAGGGCNESSSGRQLSPSSDTGQDLSAPRQQSEVRAATFHCFR